MHKITNIDDLNVVTADDNHVVITAIGCQLRLMAEDALRLSDALASAARHSNKKNSEKER